MTAASHSKSTPGHAALAVTLCQAIVAARRKAFVILGGTLLRIDRVGMGSGRDRPLLLGNPRPLRASPFAYPGCSAAAAASGLSSRAVVNTVIRPQARVSRPVAQISSSDHQRRRGT
jgi:hypothetical protein